MDLTQGNSTPATWVSPGNVSSYMNRAGLTAIVYGAWGPQINWLGTGRMTEWWREVIKATHDLDVIYCLTGESNLQIGWQDLSSKPGKAEWLQTLERQLQ